MKLFGAFSELGFKNKVDMTLYVIIDYRKFRVELELFGISWGVFSGTLTKN